MPRLLYVLVFGLPLVLGVAWLGLDQQPAQGLCCDMVADIRGFSGSFTHDSPPWRLEQGWIQALAALGLKLAGADGPLLIMLLSVSALQLGLLLSARRLADPRAGLLAAALAPALPVIALAQRRVDVFAPICALVALGLLATLASRGFTRTLPTLAFIGLSFLTFTASPHPTDNYLAMLALGGVAGGAWLRALLLGRDLYGEPLSRGRAAAWGAALLMSVLLTIPIAPSLRDLDDALGVGYYLGEMGHVGGLDPWSAQALAAYWMHLFHRGLGWTLGVPLALGALAWLWRGRGRAELLGLVLPLGLLLSLMAKKNIYYLAPAWPALALIMALGVAAMPWRRARLGATAALLLLAWTQLGVRAFPSAVAGTPLEGRFEPAYDAYFGWAFQTSDHDMDLAPRPAGLGRAVAEATLALELPSACDCRYLALSAGDVSKEEWWLRMRERDPCLQLVNPPAAGRERDVGLVLLGPARLGPPGGLEQEQGRAVRQFAERQLEPRGEVSDPDGLVQLYARPDAWFSGGCSEMWGRDPM